MVQSYYAVESAHVRSLVFVAVLYSSTNREWMFICRLFLETNKVSVRWLILELQ